jgi:glycosyltransferase involved in cell wall biosynthesis
MHKKVSVIIPAFNAAAYIRKSVESVLAQTYQNFEVIVIDDGSTDGTAEIVKSFVDKRIKYFYQENKGLSGARNAGFGLSSGEYLIFLDSDDLLEPACLEKSVAFLDKKQEFGAVYFNYFIFYWSDPKKKIFLPDSRPGRQPFFQLFTGNLDEYVSRPF